MIKFLQSCLQADKDRRILWFPVLFGLGIALYFNCADEPSKWLTLGIIEALVALAVLFRHYPQILKILAVLSCITAGFCCVQIKTIWLARFHETLPDGTFYFKGQIARIDTNYQGRPRFTLKNPEDFDGKIYKGLYRVTQRSADETAAVGDCVEMVGTLSPLPSEVVVGGYQFDRRGFFEGLKGSGFAESRWFKIDCEKSVVTGANRLIAHIRQKIVRHIRVVLPANEAAVAGAIIAGEKGKIAQDQYANYRNAGLAHFLSISGLHMTMLAGLMFFLVRFVCAVFPPLTLKYDTKKIAAVFAFAVSLAYLFISGAAVPALRAFVMTTLVLIGVLIDRRAISMYTVALAATVVLVISPEVLVSASFQMSFAAVVGLIAFYEKTAAAIQKWLKNSRLWKFPKIVLLYVLGVVLSDFIASLMTMPFSIYHFNMIAVYTTLGNLLAGPIIGFIIMPMVLFSLVLMPFGLDSLTLKAAGYGIYLLNQITAYVAALPYAGYKVASMPHWGLMAIVVGGLWMCLWRAKWRYFGLVGIFVGIVSLWTVQTPDILVAPQAKAFAFKNTQGALEIAAGRSGRFAKEIWKNKYPVTENKTALAAHPEIKASGQKVTVGGQTYDLEQAIGLSAWQDKRGGYTVKTIREDIGHRLWN